MKSRPGIAHTVDRLDQTGEIVEQHAGVEDFELTHPYPGVGQCSAQRDSAPSQLCCACDGPSILELTQARRAAWGHATPAGPIDGLMP
jgi:hypothetical protein